MEMLKVIGLVLEDSRADILLACFHTSCEPLDTIDRGLSPRESVEVRAIVVTSNKAITD